MDTWRWGLYPAGFYYSIRAHTPYWAQHRFAPAVMLVFEHGRYALLSAAESALYTASFTARRPQISGGILRDANSAFQLEYRPAL